LREEAKQISKNTAVYFFANVLTKAAAFFLIPVYTIFFTTKEYGILNLVQITASFIFIFYILGLRASIKRFYFDYKEGEEGQKKLIGIITLFTFLVGLFFSILLSIFGKYIFLYFLEDVPFRPYLFIAVWIAFFRIFHQIKLAVLQNKQKAFFYTLLDSGFILANILLTIIVVVVLKKGLTGKVWLDLFLIITFSIISLILLLKDMKLHTDFTQIKAPLKFSLPLIPHMLSGFLMSTIDRIFLERIIDLETVGLYSLAFNIGLILYMFIDSVRLSYTPYFNKTAVEEGDKAKPKFAKITTYAFLLYTLAGIFLIIFSKEFISLISDKDYHQAYTVFPVIIFTNVLNGLYFFFVRPLLYLKSYTRFVSIATLIAAMVNIGLNYFLIIEYGMKGAVWATFISIAVKLVLVWYFAQKKYFIKYELKRLLIILFILILAMFSFYVFEQVDFSLFILIVCKFSFFIALLSVLIIAKFFDKKEYQFAQEIVFNFKNKLRKR
jgi:O-antigen/teichoic acid export membrane protein